MTDLGDILAKRADLEDLYRDQKDAVKATESEISALDTEILDRMVESQMQKVTVGGYTFYIAQTLRARADLTNEEAALAAFEAEGLGFLVKRAVNANSLSSALREMLESLEEEGNAPADPTEVVSIAYPNLEPYVSAYNDVKLRARKA